jgi:endonuclease/exonuclease/phosphatase family metal-dependent hydrolase
MIDWLRKDTADIKCLQEFYYDKKSPIFNTVHKLENSGEYQYYGKASVTNRIGAEFGLAIFSKYPMINKGEVITATHPEQYAIFADVLIGQDTLRIYNVHLQSMKINEDYIEIDRAGEQFFNVADKLKYGFISRAKQVQSLTAHMDACPYKYIICGDINDIPYSYTYFTLRSKLKNAFEEAANGFGFSYNGKLFFLRIDNQFYSAGLETKSYTTHREINYSDHFPIRTGYSFKSY